MCSGQAFVPAALPAPARLQEWASSLPLRSDAPAPANLAAAEIVGLLDEHCQAADYSQRRQTALLSATLHSNLGSLASLSLREDAAAVGEWRGGGGWGWREGVLPGAEDGR